jgi:Arm DNA-binding domain
VIKKRGNCWWVVVYAGRDPLTGKKRQKTGTAATKAEARQLEAASSAGWVPASTAAPPARPWPNSSRPGSSGAPRSVPHTRQLCEAA